jgi:hypothetical protein
MLLIDLRTYFNRPFLLRLRGCLAYLLSLSEPEGLISGQFTRKVLVRPAIEHCWPRRQVYNPLTLLNNTQTLS